MPLRASITKKNTWNNLEPMYYQNLGYVLRQKGLDIYSVILVDGTGRQILDGKVLKDKAYIDP